MHFGNQKYIWVGLAILIGLGFEGLKNLKQPVADLPTESQSKYDIEAYSRRGQLTDNGQLRNRFQKTAQENNLKTRQVIAQNTQALSFKQLEENHSFDHGNPSAKPSAVAAADNKKAKGKIIKDEKGNRYIVDEKGNLKKLKKKKRKKSPTEEANATDEAVASNDSEQQDDEHSPQQLSNSYVPVAIAVGKKNNDTPQEILTAEEWKKILLNQVDAVQTTKFIQEHQSSLVTDGVYFEIAQLMLEDSRQPMREQGLIVLGSFPSLQSFLMLADLMSSEPIGSDLRKKSESYLNTYTQLRHVHILGSVLATSTSFTAIEIASNKIESAANTHLSSKNDDPNADHGRLSTTTKNARYFTNLLTSLENASNTVKDPNAIRAVTQALNTLKSLLENHVAINEIQEVGP